MVKYTLGVGWGGVGGGRGRGREHQTPWLFTISSTPWGAHPQCFHIPPLIPQMVYKV